jgi:atypical dual specificity phosphatase
MLEWYAELGIAPVHYPIHDFNETDLTAKLYEGANTLKRQIDAGQQVFVHCTAGMGRAPAAVLVFLCLYKGMEPEEADLFVKSHRKVSVPNMRAVKNVVNLYSKKVR